MRAFSRLQRLFSAQTSTYFGNVVVFKTKFWSPLSNWSFRCRRQLCTKIFYFSRHKDRSNSTISEYTSSKTASNINLKKIYYQTLFTKTFSILICKKIFFVKLLTLSKTSTKTNANFGSIQVNTFEKLVIVAHTGTHIVALKSVK